jgi:hypothetical protein
MSVGKAAMSAWAFQDETLGKESERLYFASSYKEDDKYVYVFGANMPYYNQFHHEDEDFINLESINMRGAKSAFKKAFAGEISKIKRLADRCEIKFCATMKYIDF